MIYALTAITGIFCLLFAGLFYQMRKTDKKILGQISLIARGLRTNISETKVVGKKLDMLRSSEAKAAEFNRKTAEHQRVLLASLNQQIQRLEIMYVSENRNTQQRVTPVQPRTARDLAALPNGTAAKPVPAQPARNSGVVRLEEIFKNRNTAVVEEQPNESLDLARKMLGGGEITETEIRRALNG